jgi:hypothetical protein
MEMMHPSLTMVIMTSPESYLLMMMVASGIVGMAVGILILEAITHYWFPDESEATSVRRWATMKAHKNDTSLAGKSISN